MATEYKIPTVAEIKARLEKEGPRFKVVSLFAGGGGSSSGYRMAGGKVLAINEFIPAAQECYRANWPDTKIFTCDIRKLTGAEILEAIGMQPGELDILDGSPPCSAFSMVGKRDKLWGKSKKYSDAEQHGVENLFFEYVRILKELRPKCFVAENVAGLTKAISRGFLNEFLRAFDEAGYECRAKLLNAKYLGVPQNRPRLIFVGVRKDLWRPEFEGKTHPKPFPYIVPLKTAIKGLVHTEAEMQETDISKYAIYNELKKLKPGEISKKYFSLIKSGPDKPAYCLTATSGQIGAAKSSHWENRAFTVKESMRISSIPDDYILTGTYQQKIERLGRMVPPLMMKAVAENLYNNILKELK